MSLSLKELNNITKFENDEEISFIICENFNTDIVIMKGLFDVKLKNLDKLLSLENRDIYIFHLELTSTVEYIDNSISQSVKVIEKKLLTSKVFEIKPKTFDNLKLKPQVNVSYGEVNNLNNILYCTMLLKLVLGGSSYAN